MVNSDNIETGLAKAFGADIVQRWRLGLLDRPPAMTEVS